MSQIHPKIISALRAGELLSNEEIHRTIKLGHTIFTTQNFLNIVAQQFTATHLRAALDFIEKFLGNYESCEMSSPNASTELRLSYFTVKETGRDGYCIRCAKDSVEFLKISSLDGLTTYKSVMAYPLK